MTRGSRVGIADGVAEMRPVPADAWLPTLEGRAWAFGFELAATQILAEAHATLAPLDACRHLLAAIDPHLAEQLARDDVLVADEMTGTTSSVNAALAALAGAGITVLLARRFAEAFSVAGRAHGITTLVLDAPSFIHSGDRLRIDLDAGKVVNLSSGDRAPIRNLGDAEREALHGTLAARPR